VRACAIVPQKPLAVAKSRLGDVLRADARASLSLTLLRRVCASLRAAPAVEDVVVMTPDPDVRAFAAASGVRSVPDPCAGFNEALVEVIRSLPAHSHAILIMAADLPLLRPADVVAFLAAGMPRTAVLAPARDGNGTNALLVPPATAIRPVFGPASLALHRSLVRALGLRIAEVNRVGLAFDLDTPADLVALGLPAGKHTHPRRGAGDQRPPSAEIDAHGSRGRRRPKRPSGAPRPG
jgi:2-phospho-L-lactate guanylyltransferase